MRASAIRFTKSCALSVLMAAALGTPAWADEVADVRALMQAHKLEDAYAKANAFLVRQPKDAQMRFLLGLILSDQNKPADAIAVFTRLTEDYPNLPEPHNNLAALLSGSGQYDKARVALENALRANPNYAVARENLGDVYAKLANETYTKLLAQDPNNANVKLKQSWTAKIVGSAAGDSAPAASKPVAAPAAAMPPVAKPAVNEDAVRGDVLNTVNSWAKAWSAKDVDSYLGFYGDDFRPPSGLSLAKWKEQRRSLIEGKGRIEVKVEEPKVELNGSTATVTFRQVYASDRVSDKNRKTLVLAKAGNQWKIQQERSK